jgi:hypothetical protein
VATLTLSATRTARRPSPSLNSGYSHGTYGTVAQSDEDVGQFTQKTNRDDNTQSNAVTTTAEEQLGSINRPTGVCPHWNPKHKMLKYWTSTSFIRALHFQ